MAIDSSDLSADSLVVGVDLGGTKIEAILVSADLAVVARSGAPTPNRAGGAAVVDTVAALVTEIRAASSDPDRITAIGIGSAGVIDVATGTVTASTDAIAGWAGTKLAAELTTRTGLPVRVVNDVHAHAIGLHALSAFPGDADLLVMAIGTGIGGCFIEAGVPRIGTHGVSGHFGHIACPQGAGIVCSCGAEGHAEGIGSGPGILAAFQRAGGEASDTREVARRAASGDARADTAITIGAQAAGTIAGGLANAYDPAAIIVTGGVPGIGDRWWRPFEAAARQELLPSLRELEIIRGADDAAGVGAATLWLRHVAQPTTEQSFHGIFH